LSKAISASLKLVSETYGLAVFISVFLNSLTALIISSLQNSFFHLFTLLWESAGKQVTILVLYIKCALGCSTF